MRVTHKRGTGKPSAERYFGEPPVSGGPRGWCVGLSGFPKAELCVERKGIIEIFKERKEFIPSNTVCRCLRSKLASGGCSLSRRARGPRVEGDTEAGGGLRAVWPVGLGRRAADGESALRASWLPPCVGDGQLWGRKQEQHTQKVLFLVITLVVVSAWLI